MQRIFSTLILLFIFSFFTFLTPSITLAQQEGNFGLDETAKQGFGSELTTKSQQNSIPLIVGRIINVVLSFLGIVFLILIIYGGFVWMTAGGIEDKVKQAVQIFTAASYGLLIVMAAFLITRYIGNAFINSLR